MTSCMRVKLILVAAVWTTLLVLAIGGCGRDVASNGVHTGGSVSPDDIMIDAVLEDAYTIGGADADGWQAFDVVIDADFDSHGNLAVLDSDQKRVVLVGPGGQLLRRISQAGDGPGELRVPGSVAVLPDDRIAIYDRGHHAFLLFSARGEFSEQSAIPEQPGSQDGSDEDGLLAMELHGLPDDKLLVVGKRHVVGRRLDAYALGGGVERLYLAWQGHARPLETRSEVSQIENGFTRMETRGAPPHAFGAPLLADVLSDGRVALVDSTGYSVKLVSPRGSVTDVLARPIASMPVTAEMTRLARERTSEAYRRPSAVFVQSPDETPISREFIDALVQHGVDEDLESMTFGDEVPVIADLGVDSDDRIWIVRTASDGVSDGPTDVLTAEGEYLGTVPADAWSMPLAFGPNGLMAYVETDEHDVPLVRVMRLLSLDGGG